MNVMPYKQIAYRGVYNTHDELIEELSEVLITCEHDDGCGYAFMSFSMQMNSNLGGVCRFVVL